MARRTSRSRASVPSETGLMSIGALAKATNIPVQTLRTWEQRYGAPLPTRKPSGHRLYPAGLVERLRKVTRLLELGHRPGDVLALPSARLDTLLAVSDGERVRTESAAHAVPLAAEGAGLDEMLHAVKQLDRDALTGMLQSNWIRLGPLEFMQKCAGELMKRVGEAWEAGTLEIRHEHFATACLAGFLRQVREPFDQRAHGPRVVASTLPGDVHEGGLLMASVIMAMRGCRVVYLGADTPVEQVAAAARERDVRAVALSVSAQALPRRTAKAVAALRAALPRRTALWIGGAGAARTQQGVEYFATLQALDDRLAARI